MTLNYHLYPNNFYKNKSHNVSFNNQQNGHFNSNLPNDIEGNKLASEEKRQTIIIVHGLFGHAKNWHYIAKKLSTHFLVYVIDLRNHGSSFHSQQMDYMSMSVDVQHFMQDHKIVSAHFIAHSMGGKALMYLALTLKDQQLIDKLIIVDIAPVSYKNKFGDILDGLASINLQTIKSRSEADRELSSFIPEQNIRYFLLSNLRDTRFHHTFSSKLNSNPKINDEKQDVKTKYIWQFNLPILISSIETIVSFPEHELMAPYSKHCLFIAGQDSDYIHTKHRSQLKKYFPVSNIVKVKNSGHWVHAEQAEVFLEIVSSYFSSSI